MKIQFTSKETRKISTALSLIQSTVENVPFKGIALSSTKYIDQKFTVNNVDGTSEIEIHEKSFCVFLESGSEAFVKSGSVLRETLAKLKGIWTSYRNDMDDAQSSITKHGQAFATPPEYKDTHNPASTPFCPSQEEYLKELLGKEGFAEILKAQRSLKPRIKVLPSNSESIPYEVRLQAAKQTVAEAILDSTAASSHFGVKEEDIVKGFPA